MSYQSRVTIKGQITIPKDIRDALGLAPGELAELVPNADGDYVLKHKKDVGDAIKRVAIRKQIARAQELFAKSNRFPGMSTDEYMAMIREPFQPFEQNKKA